MGGSELQEIDDDDDEYSKLVRTMNNPRVVIDNESSETATVIKVDSVKKHSHLLNVVQFLIDLNLIITKAYISFDGSWFMDVFHVTDREGNKVLDEHIISCIQTAMEDNVRSFPSVGSSIDVKSSKDDTMIELSGSDRPGVLSEVCAVLADHKCNVVKAEVWTHNRRAAAIVYITDQSTGRAIEDPTRLSHIKRLLCNVMRGDRDPSTAKSSVSLGLTHTGRRLHQMMVEDWDSERVVEERADDGSQPQVALMDCLEKGYTIVILRSKDRAKLLFDTLCTLTDMQYMVFHGTVNTGGGEAYQEYFIRHVNGNIITSETERQRVIRCLEAAIERRASEGLELELRTDDRVGLLSHITRIFRENGLCVRRAEITTEDGEAVDTFYVSDVSGNLVTSQTIDSIRSQIGQATLMVKKSHTPKPPEEKSTVKFLFGNFFKVFSFSDFSLIRSFC